MNDRSSVWRLVRVGNALVNGAFRRKPSRRALAVGVLTGAMLFAACEATPTGAGPSDDGGSGGGGAPVSTGGAPMTPVTSSGGTPSTGGAPSTGGSGSGSTVLDFPGSTITLCPGEVIVSLPLDTFEPCVMTGCSMAHCVPAAAVPEDVPVEMLGTCADPATVCIPDDYTATFGRFLAKTCESISGAEGRCISTCIPQVNGLMDALPQGDCGENERCAPCINPNDGTETGACSQGCDPGPSAETLANPIVFPTCQSGEGVCTPKEIIPEILLTHLAQLDCPSADQVCSPIEKAQNLRYEFPECTPSDPTVIELATPGPDGQLGGCVPAWLADADPAQATYLHRDSCAEGDKCAPCNNPLRGNIPTGACPVPLPSDGGEGPGTSGDGGTDTEPFDYPGSTIELCEGQRPISLPLENFSECDVVGCQMAHCVPEAALPASVPLAMLGSCAEADTACVPDDYTASFGEFLPKTCASIFGAEGRCISTCIPQVNGLMDALPKDVCGENERCAPCINPNDGTDTGACTQGCDPGPSAETVSDPVLFAKCQNGEGVCTPKTIIPAVLLTHLLQLDCPSADQVCSPIEKAQNLKYNFPACAPSDGFVALLAPPGPNGQLGGCVPIWVADGNPFEGIFLHQDTCAVGDKCAPCNNPLRGNIPTGACAVPLPSDPTGGLPPATPTDGADGGAP